MYPEYSKPDIQTNVHNNVASDSTKVDTINMFTTYKNQVCYHLMKD